MYYANKRGGIYMEYIRKCNICGNIWCYTDKDIKKSRNNGVTALLSSVGSLANTVGAQCIMPMNKIKWQIDHLIN